MHIPDSWYTFGMEFPFRSTGKRNLKTISEQYHTLKEWQARREVIRQGILKGARFPLPKRTPLNVVTHSYRELNGYSVENVFFESVLAFLFQEFIPATEYSSGELCSCNSSSSWS